MARKRLADMIDPDDAPAAPEPYRRRWPAAVAPEPIDARAVPAPYTGTAEGELDERERADLATCEAAIDRLRMAFWAAGKALQVIRDGRLYRESHGSFEAYVRDRWDMTRTQADRLIRAWPLAERLAPIGANEGQVRELLPLADRHGPDAAVVVYETVAQTDGVKVTAAVLKGAVAVVADADRFDPASAAEQIRAYLAGQAAEAGQDGQGDPAQAWEAEAQRLRETIRRALGRRSFITAAKHRPAEARRTLAELRALLDEIERGLS